MTADGWVHVTHDAEGNALVNMQEELVASARSTVADHR